MLKVTIFPYSSKLRLDVSTFTSTEASARPYLCRMPYDMAPSWLTICHQQARNPLIASKHNATTQHQPPQPHRAPPPKPPHPRIRQYARSSLRRRRPAGALRAALDRVERLADVHGDGSRHGARDKRGGAVLGHVVGRGDLLEGVVGAHARGRGDALLQRGGHESPVEAGGALLSD
jgi:hypothetical protein